MATLERIYTIPLKGAYEYVRTKRTRRAVKLVREFALRHMKAQDAKISEGVNSLLFRDGMQKPPRRIKVRIAKGDDAVAKVWLVGEEEKLKEAAEKKKTAAASGSAQSPKATRESDEAKAAEEKKREEAKKSAEAAKTAASAAKPAIQPAKPQEAKPSATQPKPASQAPKAPSSTSPASAQSAQPAKK